VEQRLRDLETRPEPPSATPASVEVRFEEGAIQTHVAGPGEMTVVVPHAQSARATPNADGSTSIEYDFDTGAEDA